MNYTEFRDTIIPLVTSRLSSDVTVTHKQILKNNDQKKEALVLRAEGSDIAPTIYLDYFYKKYSSGTAMDEIVSELIGAYESAFRPDTMEIKKLSDFENVRDRIVFRLISKKKNQTLLSDVPHYFYLDLAIVFYCLMESNENTQASFLVHSDHMDNWKIDRSELFELAVENTPRLLPPMICPIADMIKELMPETQEIGELLDFSLEEPGFYVLTNQKKLNGASAVLYENVLADFARKIESDMYVIPSSVHEVLLLPVNSRVTSDNLNEIIKDGNKSLVSPEEILSDHYYLFSRENNTLTM